MFLATFLVIAFTAGMRSEYRINPESVALSLSATVRSQFPVMNDTINDFRPEVRALIKRLVKAGFAIVACSNGEGHKMKAADQQNPSAEFIEELLGCDEGWLYIKHRLDGYWLYNDKDGQLYESLEIPAYRIVMDKALWFEGKRMIVPVTAIAKAEGTV